VSGDVQAERRCVDAECVGHITLVTSVNPTDASKVENQIDLGVSGRSAHRLDF
jgi:hypothetical protein